MDTTSSAAPAATSRRSAYLTAALGVIVALVALLFALNSIYTNWYAIFRVVHVALAVFWVGGGLTLTILGLRAERSSDPREIGTLANQAAFVGERFFGPAGLVVLLTGIGMVLNGSLGWNHFWVIAALVGYASTFVTGIAVLTPLSKKVDASVKAHGAEHPASLALIRRILLIVRVDVSVLLLVVADMVLKPFS
jgi:uncharacterized membrane protein